MRGRARAAAGAVGGIGVVFARGGGGARVERGGRSRVVCAGCAAPGGAGAGDWGVDGVGLRLVCVM